MFLCVISALFFYSEGVTEECTGGLVYSLIVIYCDWCGFSAPLPALFSCGH